MKRVRQYAAVVVVGALALGIVVMRATLMSDATPASLAKKNRTASDGLTAAKSSGDTEPRRAIRASDEKYKWDQEFQKAKSAYAFIRMAAPRALTGDSRAAYYVGLTVQRCYNVPRRPNAASVGAFFDEEESALRNGPQASKSVMDILIADNRELRSYCGEYAVRDPFDGLPAIPGRYGYYTPRSWSDLAYTAGDALALADHALLDLGAADMAAGAGEPSRASEATALLENAQQDIYKSVASGEAAAIFELAQNFQAASHRATPEQPYALILAACILGYDCNKGGASASPRYLGCSSEVNCKVGANLQETLQASLGEDLFQTATSQARLIVDASRRGDTEALQSFVSIGSNISTPNSPSRSSSGP